MARFGFTRSNVEFHCGFIEDLGPLGIEDESVDVVVSNCVINLSPFKDQVFKEIARVLKPGGILLCGLDNGINFLVSDDERQIVNTLPFNPLKNPEQMKQLTDTDSGVQFSHTMEEQIGGQLEAGFVLTHLYEDTNGEGYLHEVRDSLLFSHTGSQTGDHVRQITGRIAKKAVSGQQRHWRKPAKITGKRFTAGYPAHSPG